MSSGHAPVSGGRLAYDVEGEGLPLVLVHAGICDRRMWDGVWQTLAARHRVVRYDARGFGESGPATVTFSPRADLVALLDDLGVDRAALCGVSYGGRIVLETALEYPQRVAALALVCCAVDWDTAPAALRARWKRLTRPVRRATSSVRWSSNFASGSTVTGARNQWTPPCARPCGR